MLKTLFSRNLGQPEDVVKVDDEDNNCLNDSLTEPDALVPLPVKIRPTASIEVHRVEGRKNYDF